MGAMDIPITRLLLGALLLIIPVLLILEMKLNLLKALFSSILRMVIQLAAIGLVLDYLFAWNNPYVTIGWMSIMLASATLITIERLDYPKIFLLPVIFIPFLAASFIVLPYIITVVVRPVPLFNTKYLIPLYGMLLGNSISSATLAVERLTGDLRLNWKAYYSRLAFGATPQEAMLPFQRNALRASLIPRILNISTMGLVTLPGMMTGQILGGSPPTTAIKYQMLIMIAIMVSATLCVYLAMKLLVARLFDKYGFSKLELER
jgi:putative ABC transport system permease protein